MGHVDLTYCKIHVPEEEDTNMVSEKCLNIKY